jgi:hypothetical protein
MPAVARAWLEPPEDVAQPGRERRREFHRSQVTAGELGELRVQPGSDRGARAVEEIVAQVSAFGERDHIRTGGESDRYFQRNHATTISRNDAAKLPDLRARSPTSGGRPPRQIGGSARVLAQTIGYGL